MPETMRAAVADGHGGIEISDLAIPAAAEGWVVIAPVGTGVCGTDLHLIEGDYPHGRFPVVPGHEFAGYISEVGPGVTRFAEGDYVGVNPNVSCGKCTWCRQGATNLCVELFPVGVAINGSCAEYVAVPQQIVFRLNTAIEHRAAPLIEPFACVLHALERVPGWRDDEIVVFGAGSIGLMAVILARAEGAAGIRIVEPNPTRRAAALELGALQADDICRRTRPVGLRHRHRCQRTSRRDHGRDSRARAPRPAHSNGGRLSVGDSRTQSL